MPEQHQQGGAVGPMTTNVATSRPGRSDVGMIKYLTGLEKALTSRKKRLVSFLEKGCLLKQEVHKRCKIVVDSPPSNQHMPTNNASSSSYSSSSSSSSSHIPPPSFSEAELEEQKTTWMTKLVEQSWLRTPMHCAKPSDN